MVAYMKGKLRALVMQLQTQAKSDAIGQWHVAYGNEERYSSASGLPPMFHMAAPNDLFFFGS